MADWRSPIALYHSLLTDEMGQMVDHEMTNRLRREGLYFGDRPLCSVLRPRFFTMPHYRFVQGRMRVIMSAFEKVYRAAMADTSFLEQFGLLDWEKELIRIDSGFPAASPTSRMDTFFNPATMEMYLTEYNAETPAAVAYNDSLSEVFLTMPIMREFEKQYEFHPIPSRHHMLQVMLDSYHAWGGRNKPTVAIVDWKEVPTYSEFLLFQHYFQLAGLECHIIDPRDMEYRNGRLSANGIAIDIIYKRVLITELYERGGMDHPIIQALRDHAVCMVNPFQCKILYKKASLAVMSDEANAHLFNAAELAAIQAHIPWTRVLNERHTTFQQEKIDLVPFVQANKDMLVLKPNDDYGGHGIVLGWEVDQSRWETAVAEALQTPTIIQKRITLPSEPYPSLVNGKVEIYDRLFDTAPFIWNGDYMSGCLTRLSTDSLLNVTAGGGSTVATFIVEERP